MSDFYIVFNTYFEKNIEKISSRLVISQTAYIGSALLDIFMHVCTLLSSNLDILVLQWMLFSLMYFWNVFKNYNAFSIA